MATASPPFFVVAGVGVVTLACAALLMPEVVGPPCAEPPSRPLLVFCAASMKHAVTEVARDYERECGRRVELQFGGSGTLLATIRLARVGDLFVAADESYADIARGEGLVAEAIPIANQKPVIAVAQGNPKRILGPADLLRDDVSVGLANPEAASIGAATRRLLGATGDWARVSAATRSRGVFKPTVSDIAADVKLGTIDAAIVWDATVRQPEFRSALEAVEIAGADAFTARVTVCVLRSAARPAAALRFARYLAEPGGGAAVFSALGFTPVGCESPGDVPAQ